MQEYAFAVKATLSGVAAIFSASQGYLGWMTLLWALCMALDYASGSFVAHKTKQWNSYAARQGLAGKGGMILFVFGAAALDILLGILLEHVAALHLPFAYTMPVCSLVLGWYILTEVGSIFENAEKLGAQFPPFLKEFLAALRKHLFTKQKPDDDESTAS